MAAGLLELSLDDIIKKNKTTSAPKFQRGRGQAGQQRGNFQKGNFQKTSPFKKPFIRRGGDFQRYKPYAAGGQGDVNSKWDHDLFEDEHEQFAPRSFNESASYGTKLCVTNLEYTVSESDIKELFSEFGPIVSSSIQYDRSGRSNGIAEVVFKNNVDALNAQMKYNNVALDGRPMTINLVPQGGLRAFGGGPKKFQSRPAFQRGFGGGRPGFGAGKGGFGGSKQGFGGSKAGGGFRSNRKEGKASISSAELDAQLDEYKKGTFVQ